MKNETKQNGMNMFSIAIIILFAFSIFVIISQHFNINNLQKENKLYNVILSAEMDVSEISVDSQTAESYYNEATFSYEKSDYNSVESNSRLARGYYFSVSQKYKDLEAKIKQSGVNDKLIDIYTEALQTLSDVNTNMYEACEYFESTARYYYSYYDANGPDSDYTMGTNQLDLMNAKIATHDENVKKFNNLLSEFKTELEVRLTK